MELVETLVQAVAWQPDEHPSVENLKRVGRARFTFVFTQVSSFAHVFPRDEISTLCGRHHEDRFCLHVTDCPMAHDTRSEGSPAFEVSPNRPVLFAFPHEGSLQEMAGFLEVPVKIQRNISPKFRFSFWFPLKLTHRGHPFA